MNVLWLMAILVAIGLALIAVDFYLPGFVLGSIGIVLMLVAVGLCYRDYGLNWACVTFLIEAALGVGAGWAAIKYVPQTAAGQKMILSHEQTAMRAGTAASPELLGAQGVAQTFLRPSGMAVLGGKRLDVVAESGMIEKDSAIKVVAVEGTRIIVRKV